MADPSGFIPYLVSERESGGWEDCTWASGVMLGNAFVAANVHPATRAEYQGLRAATGYLHAEPIEGEKKGGNIDDLIVGMRNRYKVGGYKVTDISVLMDNWRPGMSGAVQGMNGSLPVKARGGSSFTGAHCIFAVRRLDGQTVALNPLQANGTAPVPITMTELANFFKALPGAGALIGGAGQEIRRNPMNTFNLERWKIPAGHPIHEYPGGPKISSYAVADEITTIGDPMDRVADGSAYRIAGWKAIIINTAAIDNVKQRKTCYIPTVGLVAVASDPSWDARVYAMIDNPSATFDPTIDPAKLKAEFNRGVDAANAKLAGIESSHAAAVAATESSHAAAISQAVLSARQP